MENKNAETNEAVANSQFWAVILWETETSGTAYGAGKNPDDARSDALILFSDIDGVSNSKVLFGIPVAGEISVRQCEEKLFSEAAEFKMNCVWDSESNRAVSVDPWANDDADTRERKQALFQLLGGQKEDIEESGDGSSCVFKYGPDEYLVLTDEEADNHAQERIENSLWACNTSFLCSHISGANERTLKKALQMMQEQMCEDANPIIARMIDDLQMLVDDAISVDGRGHFLDQYDGQENEERVNGKMFFIYRQ